jgi:hypothetical protein
VLYPSDKAKLPKYPAPLIEATKIGFRESDAIGVVDRELVSFLKKYGHEDLGPLISYLVPAKKYDVPVDEIAKRIQHVKNVKPFPAVKRLFPYKEVLHYVAEKLGTNHSDDQPVDRLET